MSSPVGVSLGLEAAITAWCAYNHVTKAEAQVLVENGLPVVLMEVDHSHEDARDWWRMAKNFAADFHQLCARVIHEQGLQPMTIVATASAVEVTL